MSLISTRSRYGLRLLLDLADRRGEGPVDLGSIARRQEIPEKYLAKLIQPLRGAGLLSSARGARGGYRLARDPRDIDLLEVVELLEGRISLLDCSGAPERCPRSEACPARPLWKGLEDSVRAYLGARRLADLAGPESPDYSI